MWARIELCCLLICFAYFTIANVIAQSMFEHVERRDSTFAAVRLQLFLNGINTIQFCPFISCLMRHIQIISTSLLFFCFVLSISKADSTDSVRIRALLETNGSSGTEFWLGFPPNERPGYSTTELHVYVCAVVDTDIEITDPLTGQKIRRFVRANSIYTLTVPNREIKWEWEVRETQQPVRKGVRITSTHPVTVAVANVKSLTSDSYLALPVSSLGTNYVVSSYWDCNEAQPWAGGFLIVATADMTIITVNLRGAGADVARTSDGTQINTGIPLVDTLNAGDVYMVKGDATTRGEFDLSGTQVLASKPIGIVAFHERTLVPGLLQNGNGRNHLCEMLLPVSQCGTSFVTTNFLRRSTSSTSGGDYFRIVAIEANTTWSVKYFDPITKQQRGSDGGRLIQAGSFVDISQSQTPTQLISGDAVWTTDKPVILSQISTSGTFDNSPNFDPFLTFVSPRERWPQALHLLTANSALYGEHDITVFAELDENHDSTSLMKIMVNGRPLYNHPDVTANSNLLLGRIPGTNVFRTRLRVYMRDSGFVIVGDRSTRLSGVVYGNGTDAVYGWSSPSLNRFVIANDTMPPVITQTTSTPHRANFVVTEQRNVPSPRRPVPLPSDQVESGLASVWLMDSSNVALSGWVGLSMRGSSSASFSVQQTDLTQPASATVIVTDNNGNYSEQRVSFGASESPFLRFVDTVNLPLGSTTRRVATVHNPSSEVLTVSSAEIKLNVNDTIGLWSRLQTSLPLDIPAKSSVQIDFDLSAVSRGTTAAVVHVTTGQGVLTDSFTVVSRAANLALVAQDIVSPSTSEYCDTSLVVFNVGDDTLRISKVLISHPRFRIKDTLLPLTIAPSERAEVLLCHTTDVSRTDTAYVIVESNSWPKQVDTAVVIAQRIITSVESGETSELRITPHPVVDVFTTRIESITDESVRFYVHDQRGTELHSGIVAVTSGSVTLDVSALPRGYYIVSLATDSNTIRIPFVKSE